MRPETETGQRVTREWHERRYDYPDPFADVIAIEQEARRMEQDRLREVYHRAGWEPVIDILTADT